MKGFVGNERMVSEEDIAEPEDSEEDKSNGGDNVCPLSNNSGQDAKFLHEWCVLFTNFELVLGEFGLSEGALANS